MNIRRFIVNSKGSNVRSCHCKLQVFSMQVAGGEISLFDKNYFLQLYTSMIHNQTYLHKLIGECSTATAGYFEPS